MNYSCTYIAFFLVSFSLLYKLGESKPQCGLRWRGPCGDTSQRQRSSKPVREYDVNKIEEEIMRKIKEERMQDEAKRNAVEEKLTRDLHHRNVVADVKIKEEKEDHELKELRSLELLKNYINKSEEDEEEENDDDDDEDEIDENKFRI